MFKRYFVSVLVIVSVTSIVGAQTQRSIVGTVSDESGGVLPGVTVELTTDIGTEITVTDDTGSYRFDSVSQSQAAVTFRLINFSQTIFVLA